MAKPSTGPANCQAAAGESLHRDPVARARDDLHRQGQRQVVQRAVRVAQENTPLTSGRPRRHRSAAGRAGSGPVPRAVHRGAGCRPPARPCRAAALAGGVGGLHDVGREDGAPACPRCARGRSGACARALPPPPRRRPRARCVRLAAGNRRVPSARTVPWRLHAETAAPGSCAVVTRISPARKTSRRSPAS
jgi:hypothetical protein